MKLVRGSPVPYKPRSANHLHGDEAKRQRDIFASLAYLQEHLRVSTSRWLISLDPVQRNTQQNAGRLEYSLGWFWWK